MIRLKCRIFGMIHTYLADIMLGLEAILIVYLDIKMTIITPISFTCQKVTYFPEFHCRNENHWCSYET